ncbi:hypothetical protein AGR4C_pa60036 [Agrobacterium tumefaciens str. Kerr 14]|uniref:Uncharacterized protein n=1 Tax=Agrobacterium tumefaciens str. Kerr 14 TaxID=1183424 RepID=A0A1S7SB61_AGRTU|nr:hypothetical protein AGR4C_pa60036 [Agrobacterium tumefaciens str. Kerr 14]
MFSDKAQGLSPHRCPFAIERVTILPHLKGADRDMPGSNELTDLGSTLRQQPQRRASALQHLFLCRAPGMREP